ncbi:sensor histidine kinase [Geobacter pickeringii]|uniref:sensor histidine kinase n=1 Tax=Geobacter pickeringii TaxID=345632 RepID=UPI0006902F49|nr:ATP-binding protein [Geobacter pickeringii]
MTIRARLITIALLPMLLALLAGLCHVLMAGRIQEQRRDTDMANRIAREVFELNFLTDRYLIYGGKALKNQWFAKHGRLGTLLAEVRFRDEPARKLLLKLRTAHGEMETIFALLISDRGHAARESGDTLLQEQEERFSGILLIKAHEMFAAASSLAGNSRQATILLRDRFETTLVLALAVLAVIVAIASFAGSRRIMDAIDTLLKGTETVATGNLDHRVGPVSRDELGKLAAAFDAMTERLQKAMAAQTATVRELRQEVAQRQEAEETLHAETLERIRAVEELREKERLLMQQGRLAALGEMIGNIAHQWRQPLNTLGLLVQQLPLMQEEGELNGEVLDATVAQAMEVICHMSRTIDDFRHFFRPDKEKVEFPLNQMVARAVALVEDNYREQRIALDVDAAGDPRIIGYPNEYSQVLLNILLNARDAFEASPHDHPRVVIRVGTENGRSVVTITDNAGGIGEAIMPRIFDPYFTTKDQDRGTGVGLFLSKTIIEKNMHGRLTARNTGDGAEFRIEV